VQLDAISIEPAEWGLREDETFSLSDLVAPGPDEQLAAFPPDLVEESPLRDAVAIDAFVLAGQLSAEVFLSMRSRDASKRMASARERLAAGDSEALAHALTSCRRALHSLADEVYPARRAKVVDRSGAARVVNDQAFKNRLLMFLSEAVASDSTLALGASQLDHLVARLDALVRKLGKGVHADVLRAEAEHAYVETWSFIAHIARYAAG
jgi:hypothetical protein